MKRLVLMSGLFCLLAGSPVAAQTYYELENPIAVVNQNPGFCSIIHTWGFIGDSLCSGEHESRDEQGKKDYHDYYDYSWGQRICALTGTKGDNYSQGGEWTKGWISNFWDNPKNRNNNICAKDSPKQAYIMALGVNDRSRKYAVGDVKTDINKADFTKNADTFTGSYAGIIQRIKSIQPLAKFFLVTDPRGSEDDGYNKVIRQMAEVFENVYILDLKKYGPDYSNESDFHKRFFLGGHLNAMGYEYTAWMFMTYIDWIIRHHMEDFEQTAFIGTGYKY